MRMVLGDLKITSASTERQKRSQNLAPVLAIISGNSLVFSRKIITSTGFYRCCAPGASAPVVVKNQSPRYPHSGFRSRGRSTKTTLLENHPFVVNQRYKILSALTPMDPPYQKHFGARIRTILLPPFSFTIPTVFCPFSLGYGAS